MKILLYTVSDFNPSTLDCIDLLVQSIGAQEYDFCILSNKNYQTKYQVFYDESYRCSYIGGLKYNTQILPKNYDYYIYLDSDILYFDSLDKLLPHNHELSIVSEYPLLVKASDWFHYGYSHYVEENLISNFFNSIGLNAGTFAYHQSKISYIEDIYKTFLKALESVKKNTGRLEQSVFNYMMHKYTNFNSSSYNNLSNFTQLHAHKFDPSKNKTLYHFCGFFGQMETKYQNMKVFYDKYLQQK
jgi:lipopolysaccharide biosynthesis glycosyltransferase